MKKIILLILLLSVIFFCGNSYAVEITDVGGSARFIGLGRAYTAMLGAADSVLSNPASLNKVITLEANTMFVGLSNDSIYTTASLALPTTMGVIGLGFAKEASGGIPITTLEANGRVSSLGSVDYDNTVFVVDYASVLNYSFINDLNYGFKLKYYSKGASQIKGATVSGIGFDLGLIYGLGPLSAGLEMTNFMSKGDKWGNGATEEADAAMKMGLRYKVMDSLQVLVDMISMKSGASGMNAGVEYKYNKELTLRGGMQQTSVGAVGSSSLLVFGLGYRIKNLNLDYAYTMDSKIKSNSIQFISLSLQLGDETAMENSRRVEKVEKQIANMMEAWVGVAEKKLTAGGAASDAMDVASIVRAVLPDNQAAKDLLDKIEKNLGNREKEETADKDKEKPKVRKVMTEKQKLTIRESLANALNYFYLGEYQLAVNECKKILKEDPNDLTALKRLGSIYYVIGDKKNALAMWRQAHTLDPTNKELERYINDLSGKK